MSLPSSFELSSFAASRDEESEEEEDETARLTRVAASSDDASRGCPLGRAGTRASSPRSSAATQTATYTLGFVILGLMVGSIGPALPELRANVGVSFERLGAVFLARWLGGVAGSALGGKLLDACPRSHVPYAASVLVAALGAACIPLARSLRAVVAAFLVSDLGLGVLICHGNTLCVWANADNPAPAVNVVNGGFGAGAFCAPLVLVAARASGGGAREAYWSVALAAAAAAAASLRVDPPEPPPNDRDEGEDDEKIHNRDDDDDDDERVERNRGDEEDGQRDGHKDYREDVDDDDEEDAFDSSKRPSSPSSPSSSSPPPLDGWRASAATAATATFLALVVGVEISFGAFLVLYARGRAEANGDDANGRREVSESEADLATTAFWGAFTLGRFAMAAASRRVRPAPSIAAHLSVTIASLAVVFLGRGGRASLWCGAIGFGAGMSSLFAAAVAQLHETLGGMRGAAGGWVSAGASSGTLVQLAASRTTGSPDALMGTLLALAVAAGGVMAGLWGGVVGVRRSFAPALVAEKRASEGERRRRAGG